ncbi:P-type conjugative transfer protein VirB9 [Yersinia ruckeri]|uniref:P-type conjugative transfer protein VirB9 n=1 Tax=Yersinia ruckeri TaxID=29486 RepID=UPI001876F85F|nr:P-type conjugative transfer protein VirB9 [Yersinia ruckeri]MCK8537994.1 P-type conjugative transfer protein VirB9 [Yersinia ruckeri]MCK8569741.1 P-type conjugative transfer protein VirB9 [Yersinia ruckeri]MCK8574177.1 P-type conjugative transfer protein VirB9 [Yersinia ruckeri]MCK8579185.1 P-type conjugative transfer protein VirB9 [Yersinia ruckeri]MCK8580367.1 P-type conjugative transfer protein VirB9 [Yersinia ruckeri]
MMLKKTLILWLILASCGVWGAAIPRGSTYDSRMQNVTYNNQDSTVVNTRSGYITILLFDDNEEVIDAQVGFPKGWMVTKSDNRVGVSPNPITQPVTDDRGNNVNNVFLPTAKEWKTNLFVVTSKRNYSLELNVLDSDSLSQAFIIRYRYPDDERQQADTVRRVRLKLPREIREKQQIAAAFQQARMPRNWRYIKRVATGSTSITPDFTYDDGRFVYLGFSSVKTLPSTFQIVNGQEQTVTPQITKQGNYTVMVLRILSPYMVLRYGSSVVGIENMAFGSVTVANGDTVSSTVTLEAR